MTVLLIALTFGIIIFGYYIMKQIDDFIGRGGIIDPPKGKRSEGILILGTREDKNCVSKKGYRCTQIDIPEIPINISYSAVFALSDKDEVNLLLCSKAKKSDSDVFVIARCNNSQLYDEYIAAGADRVLTHNERTDSILSELRKK